MATKTFKVGEYGYRPTYKVNTFKDEFSVSAYDLDGDLSFVKHYSYDAVHNFELDMCEECSSYHASIMVEWVHKTKEYKASFKPDPFATFTFSMRS